MEEYKPKNREKAKEPRGKSHWCVCDRTKVNHQVSVLCVEDAMAKRGISDD